MSQLDHSVTVLQQHAVPAYASRMHMHYAYAEHAQPKCQTLLNFFIEMAANPFTGPLLIFLMANFTGNENDEIVIHVIAKIPCLTGRQWEQELQGTTHLTLDSLPSASAL